MKKIIILLLALLMSACSAVKPSEILSSMQTEPTAEPTVTETAAPEETTEPTPKETEPVIETSKEKTTESPVTEHPEQKPAPEITTDTITETTAEPPTTQKTPIETVLAPGAHSHFESGKFSQFWPEPGTNPAQ